MLVIAIYCELSLPSSSTQPFHGSCHKVSFTSAVPVERLGLIFRTLLLLYLGLLLNNFTFLVVAGEHASRLQQV